jgi:RimJ/RimL family protein N-acetyltransferase
MLQGKRIRLRSLEINDAKISVKWRGNQNIRKPHMGFPFPVSLSQEEHWIEEINKNSGKDRLYLAIELLKNKKFIGILNIREINWINGTCKFGAMLDEPYWGKGYFKEAMSIFFPYVFYELNLRKLIGEALSHNTASIQACEKMGFVRRGVLPKHIFQDNRYHDMVIMDLLRDDYQKIGSNKK